MIIKIYHPEGSCPSTPNVELSNAQTHIAARDQWASEAKILLAYNAGNWDHWTEIDSADDWAEYEYDHDSAKNSIRRWDCVATFGATFPDGDETGAADVQVCVGQCGDYWYLYTRDDAGGSDDCDATPYESEDEAREAAKEYAEEHDECDGLSAKDWLKREREGKIKAGKSEDGEWVLAHEDGTRWDDDRYSDRDAAETAIGAWYAGVKNANPGTDIIWRLMDTPVLARINEDGETEIVEEDEP